MDLEFQKQTVIKDIESLRKRFNIAMDKHIEDIKKAKTHEEFIIVLLDYDDPPWNPFKQKI